MRSIAAVVLVATLGLAACGDDDKKDDGKAKDLARDAHALCQQVDAAAAELAKGPGERVSVTAARELQDTVEQAAVVEDDAGEVGGEAGEQGEAAAGAAKESAEELQDLSGEDREQERVVARAKSSYDDCSAAVKRLGAETGDDDLADDLDGAGFDALTKALEKQAKSEDEEKSDETDQTQTTPSTSGESSDLPLCSEGPPPCRGDDGSIQGDGGTSPGPGPGGGESSDLPECSAGVTPCRNPDGSVQP